MKDLNRHFFQEDGQQQVKRCSTSLVIKEMQIKTSMRLHFTVTVMTIKKKISVGENVENLELVHITGGKVKWFSH